MSDNEGLPELPTTNSKILADLHRQVRREKEPQNAESDDNSEVDAEGESDDEVEAKGNDRDDEVVDEQAAQIPGGDDQAAQVLEDGEQLAQGQNNADGVKEGGQNTERDEPSRKNPNHLLSDITEAHIVDGKRTRKQTNQPIKKEAPNGPGPKTGPKKTAIKIPVRKSGTVGTAPRPNHATAQGNGTTQQVNGNNAQNDNDAVKEALGRLCNNIAGLVKNGMDIYHEFVDYTTLRDGDDAATSVEKILAPAAGRKPRSVAARRNDRAKRRRLEGGEGS